MRRTFSSFALAALLGVYGGTSAVTQAAPLAVSAASPFAPTAAAVVTLIPTAAALHGSSAASQAQALQTAAIGAPVRIAIPAIGLNTRIVSVGLDQNRVPVVPDHDVGWYNLSAKPGEGENVVLWGHVLRFRHAPKTPAPFARVKELKVGARITVSDAQGNKRLYRVTQQLKVKPDQVRYILPQGKEVLTMVSCTGSNVVVKGEVVDKSHRLITIAEPVS